MKREWIIVICLLSLPLTALAKKEIDEKTDALQKYERKIIEQKKKLSNLRGREGSLLSELERYSRRIGDLEGEMSRLRKEEERLSNSASQARAEIAKLDRESAQKRSDIREYLRRLYMWGEKGYVRALLSTVDPREWRRRSYFVRTWAISDRKKMDEFEGRARELRIQKAKLEDSKEKKAAVLLSIRSQKVRLDREETDKKQLLALVRNEKAFYKKSIEELEEASKNLQRLIEELHRKKDSADSLFSTLKGKLIAPCPGSLEKKFGEYLDPKFNTRLHHKGIDIRSQQGSEVRSVFDGKVVYADWFTGYGKVLIVDHGGGYFTLYAHVSEILMGTGEHVDTGEVIGRVGDTGSLKGSYLYFELRHKGISQDPLPWFASRAFR